MAARLFEKIHLSAKGLLKKAMNVFKKVSEPSSGGQGKAREISISDCLMSALAMFKLKFPSLLAFDNAKEQEPIKQNLQNLFGIEQVPCDTYMRERLDEINPQDIRPVFTTIFSTLQRGKVLEKYEYLDGKYLLLSDGTGYFSSHSIHCKNCCEKEHRNGTSTYYHQMLGAVIAHPEHKEVIPICPEPIMKEDGAKKNDCERNATERLIKDFRREHPHLPVILVEDGLAANGPHLKLLRENNISFITVVKPDGNKSLFDWINGLERTEFSFEDENGKTHKFSFINGVPLNDSHADFEVNFIEYWEMNKDGKTVYHNTWVTDILITQENVYDITRGGRARWKIENETFNTLKNQDYKFEHNFGHGNKNLSTVFSMLMMLAFLIDQSEQICCGLFQGALKTLSSTKKYLWERIRSFFTTYFIISWEGLYRAIIAGNSREVPILDSS